MLEEFKEHIIQEFSFLLKAKLLVTVSGGLDSVVLLQLCTDLGLDISVAHCNFSLRAAESDQDALFVSNLCNEGKIPFFIKRFETTAYAKTTKTSTQIAARTLRYEWFDKLATTEGFDHILTAHHLNDALETFLINVGRGTGIEGLKGIPSINGKIVRPLLKFSRKHIQEYADKAQLQWREDSSNSTDNYVRNHLRHHAIPALQEAQPSILKGFENTQNFVQQSARLLKVYAEQLRQHYLRETDHEIIIDLEGVQAHIEPEAVLYQLLAGYGFTAWDDIYALQHAQSGKQIFSGQYRLLKDRKQLIITSLQKEETQLYQWEEGVSRISGDFGTLSLQNNTKGKAVLKNEIIVDAMTLTFPLYIRKWEEGDIFQPFGMKGKKKLSKYFKDEKLSLVAKERVWLLCDANSIVWIIGYRADDRFKITKSTIKTTKITIL